MRDALLGQYTHAHIASLNALVAAVESLDLPHLEVPDWADGPQDFTGQDAPTSLEEAQARGEEWEKYATDLHDRLEAHAKLLPELAQLARAAREALIVFDDYNPPPPRGG